MLKIDTHVHSNGVSQCSVVDCKTIIDQKRKLGYDGAILTNHCQPWYYEAAEQDKYIDRVLEEYRRGKKYADKKKFRLYLGLEVTLIDKRYTDWLLIGVTEEFLRSAPCLYKLSQKKLFELCEKNGVLLVHAHPYRSDGEPGDPQYMHGIELNASTWDIATFPRVREFAKANGLFVTCGTDYHDVDKTYFGGIYIPESCETVVDIARYIRENKGVTLFTEEGDEAFSIEK